MKLPLHPHPLHLTFFLTQTSPPPTGEYSGGIHFHLSPFSLLPLSLSPSLPQSLSLSCPLQNTTTPATAAVYLSVSGFLHNSTHKLQLPHIYTPYPFRSSLNHHRAPLSTTLPSTLSTHNFCSINQANQLICFKNSS